MNPSCDGTDKVCSIGEELLWHYALHRITRVRNLDMSFDYDSVDEEQEASAASTSGAIIVSDSSSSEDEAVQQQLSIVSPIPKASGLEEAAPRSSPAKRAVVVEDESEDDDEHEAVDSDGNRQRPKEGTDEVRSLVDPTAINVRLRKE